MSTRNIISEVPSYASDTITKNVDNISQLVNSLEHQLEISNREIDRLSAYSHKLKQQISDNDTTIWRLDGELMNVKHSKKKKRMLAAICLIPLAMMYRPTKHAVVFRSIVGKYSGSATKCSRHLVNYLKRPFINPEVFSSEVTLSRSEMTDNIRHFDRKTIAACDTKIDWDTVLKKANTLPRHVLWEHAGSLNDALRDRPDATINTIEGIITHQNVSDAAYRKLIGLK
jgi:hypothetical protein